MNYYEILSTKQLSKTKYEVKYNQMYYEFFMKEVADICFNKCLNKEKYENIKFDNCFENCEVKIFSSKLLKNN
jgi:hypothetical protein